MIQMGMAQAFQAAADYIREFGWQRGEMGQDGGPRCAGGALMSALSMTRTEQVDGFLIRARVWEAMGQAQPAGSALRCTLMNYNDLVATGPADVVDLFEGLALQYELRRLAGETAPDAARSGARELDATPA